MSFFSKLIAALSRKKRKDDEWGERFTNPPANRDTTLPLDPGRSDLR